MGHRGLTFTTQNVINSLQKLSGHLLQSASISSNLVQEPRQYDDSPATIRSFGMVNRNVIHSFKITHSWDHIYISVGQRKLWSQQP